MRTANLYDLDFAAWAAQNAEFVRAGRFSEADLEHVAQEIGDIVKRERRALRRRLSRLIQHLLKWQWQPENRNASWQAIIAEQRDAISVLLQESPSLKPGFANHAIEAYSAAARLAAIEMRRDVKTFPPSCPYAIVQLLDLDFLP